MKELHAWMRLRKERKKKGLRVSAASLALCLIVTACPNAPGAILARAAEPAAETRAGISDSGQGDYMKYENNQDGSGFTRGLNVFNVQGMDNGTPIQTTYRNQGYRTVSQVDGAKVEWNAPADIAMGGSLYGSRDITLVHNGRYARIRYTVENRGSTRREFQVGSSADVMIGNNDCAPVVGTGNGLKMEGAPKNDYTYNLAAPTATTLWYGHFSAAPDNIFNDLADKTEVYNRDSGMAWSWSGAVDPGQTWSRYALLGVGDLPPAPKKPSLAVTDPTLTVGKTGNVTGTADPGCTVCVEVAGEEFSAVADKNGRFSVPVTLSENTPTGEMPLNCYAASPQGGLSDTVTATATVVKGPFIELTDTAVSIVEESEVNDAWYEGFIKKSAGSVSYTKTVKPASVGTYTVTYTAKAAGFSDKTAKLKVTVLPKPLELTVTAASRVSGKDSFNLSAALLGTGGENIAETGFVWGVMKDPTVSMNNGKKATAAPVKTKNGSLKVTAEEIVDGINYNVRAYAKNTAGEVWYGESARFSINGKNYGTFTIKNNGDNTFTITRAGGTDDAQNVYCRTVSGSAVGGTHYDSTRMRVVFKSGETKKTVTVSEKGVNAKEPVRPATAFTNADRVYWLEIYRVDGGGQIGSEAKAKRTMPKTSAYTVNRNVYNENSRSVSTSNDNCIVADRSKTKAHQPYFTNNRGYNQSHGQKNFNVQRSLDVGTDDEIYYLKKTAAGYYYRLRLKGKEDSDAYEHVWIANHAPNNFDSSNEHNGPINIDDGKFGPAKYTARWDINNGKEADITIPGAASRTNLSGFSTSVRSGAVSGDWVQFGVNEQANVWFAATGKDTDKWRVNSYTDWILVKDEKEPQLFRIGVVNGSAYKAGDEITLSLIFDEIVDSRNSSLSSSGVTLDTSWGTFQYAGGADTNVLYFTGTVPQNASGDLKVNKINGADKIKDMCGAAGAPSGGSGSVTVNVDNKKPSVSITGPSLANGAAQATVTATNADSLRYAWTQSASMPVTGWITCTSGAKVTNRQTSGTWYLHAQATYAGTGTTAYDSRSFNFGSASAGQLPELNLSVDNSAWARERKINITARKPANASVTVKTPSGAKQTVTGSVFTATENGSYTFTLAAGEEKIVKSVAVTKIDRTNPEAQVMQPSEKTQTENVTVTVAPTDAGGSGVKTVTGTWAKTTDGGGSVTENATLRRQSDGTYQAVTPGANGHAYTYRLNLSVTDNAGNAASVSSDTYTVNLKAPTVTVRKTGGAKTGDTYSYTVNANGNVITAVNLPVGGNTTKLSGSFTLTAPGTYYVTVSDRAGHVVTSAPMTVAAGVDGDAPIVRAFQRDTDWAKAAKIELSVYEESAIKEITLQGGGTTRTLSLDGLNQEAGSAFAYRYDNVEITANGEYTVTVTDANGNRGTAKITVENIDKTPPVLTAKANVAPQASGWHTEAALPVTLSFTDPEPQNEPGGGISGIKSVQYKLVAKAQKDAGGEPTGLKTLPSAAIADGSCVVSLTQMGTYYIYAKVTDVAGNEYKGYCDVTDASGEFKVKKDQSKGSLVSITGPATAQKETDGLQMTVTVSYGPSGGEMTATGQQAAIGTLAPHGGPSTKTGSVSYTTKQLGVNKVYYKPTSWGSRYYWTYYAHRVSFDSQGGSAVPSVMVWTKQSGASTSTTVDCKVEKPTDPTRKGYTFGGWYTDANCAAGKEYDFDNQTQVKANMTLYAKWTQDVYTVEYHLMMPEYDIHFSHDQENHKAECGSSSDKKAHRHYKETVYTAPANKMQYRYGEKVILPVPALNTGTEVFEYEENGETKKETYSRTVSGFTFDGWYDNEKYEGKKYTAIGAEATGNKTYYARWIDTQAPSTNGTWSYGSGVSGWYSTSSIGLAFTDNAEIDMDSMEGQIDGGDWVKPNSINKPNYHYGSSWIAWFNEGGKSFSEGSHTYRVRAADTSGNLRESSEYVFYNDSSRPSGTMECSVEPGQYYRNGEAISETQVTGSQSVLFFKEAPTYRVTAKDVPKEEGGAFSGLYKVQYTLTELDMDTGTQKPSTEEPRYTNPQTKTVYFKDYSKGIQSGEVTFTLPENWRGKVTDIRIYDRAYNYYSVQPAIGEVVVDTTAPTVLDEKISFRNANGEYVADLLEDKWYSQQGLADKGIVSFGANLDSAGRDAEENPVAGTPIQKVRWLVNGKAVKESERNQSWSGGPELGYTDALEVSGLSGVNDITVEVTDYAGNVAAASKTIKLEGGKEQTPEASLDYPADAFAQLARNADYAITADGKTYTVNSGAWGKIPFVLPSSVTGGSAIDLCDKTVKLVKKGYVEGLTQYSFDSDAQTIQINPRPAAPDTSKIEFEAELLEDAEDAQISLKLEDTGKYTYECSPDAGNNWREVPADNTIKNLPKGNMLLRAKAKANTEGQNDGWPHGRQSQKEITSKAGKVIAEFDLNDGGTHTAQGKPANQTVSYKSALKKPAAPTREGYHFEGWYTAAKPYQTGASDNAPWHFNGEENPNVVGEILGTDKEEYQGRIQADGSIQVKLYAGWKETTPPKLKAVLETDTSADGSGKMENANSTDWYPNLQMKLTYSDNVDVTKLYYKYKNTNGTWSSYYTVNMNNAIQEGNGYTLLYTNANLRTGSQTYVFKAEDLAGNVTETEEISYHLDKSKPSLGTASYSARKNIWDWILGRKNMKITIPVTESGGSGLARVDYTLTPFVSGLPELTDKEVITEDKLDKTKAVTGQAALSTTSSTTKWNAVITIAEDFKGMITVTATDGAGNRSEIKQIGMEGNGGNQGLFVEGNAPVIGVKADPAANKTSYAAAEDLSEGYYDAAPRLFIHVEDKVAGEDKNAGIATVKWKVDRTPRGGAKETGKSHTVGENFDAEPKREYEFALNEMIGKTGVFDVTITVADQAGNQTEEKVTVKVKSKAEMPEVAMDYPNEKLTGLAPNARYDIRGEEIVADENGCIPIAEEWFGGNIEMIRKAYSEELLDSDCATAEVAARPAAPEIAVEKDETIRGKNDAQITGVTNAMEYSADGGKTWTDASAGVTDGKCDVPSGLVKVRVKATDDAPCGYAAEVSPKEGRTLNVTFHPMGGSNVSAIKDKSWQESVAKPADPERDGHEFLGWYKEAEGENPWHFEGEEDAQNADQLTEDITLYAKWRDIEDPSLDAALKTVSDGAAENADSEMWYKNLSFELAYADNIEVTKLYAKKDGGEYELIASAGGADGGADISGADPQGKTEDGYVRYQFTYGDVAEGSHTYAFKAEDADGNVMETVDMAANLDTSKPVMGGASFDSGHKNLWDWILQKESLLITVPIAETGSGVEEVAYTLVPSDENAAVLTGAAKAEKVSDGGADYQAVIAVASDFKGTVRIEAQDNAGNEADQKTIGADGEGVEGVIVEDHAPMITARADRDITGAAASAEAQSGMALSEGYYETAPAILVDVTDEENESLSGLVTGGIASVSYQIGDGAQKSVGQDYANTKVTKDSFTIPSGEIPEGVTEITITAADHAGNAATQKLTVKVKTPYEKPQAKIGYVEETLTGLAQNARYQIGIKDGGDGVEYLADDDGNIELEEGWIGRTLTVARISDAEERSASPEQDIDIPARPAAPELRSVEESHPLRRDGKITGLVAGKAYGFSNDGGTWTEMTADGNGEITGLSGSGSATGDAAGSFGTYYVREKAVDHADGTGNFTGEAAHVTVSSGPVERYQTPDAAINYRTEELTGLVSNAEYLLEYEENGETVTGLGTADEEGNMSIAEEWMDKDCQIIRSGYGVPGADSDAQSLTIPARPAAPAPMGKEESAQGEEDGRLTGFAAKEAYEISADGGESWTLKTSDENGEITPLSVAEYVARVPATDTSFKSLASEAAQVRGRFNVTLRGNGGNAGTALADYICGEGASLPADWTRRGYAFAGWHDNESLDGAAVTEITAEDTGEKTYWAKWEDNIAPVIGELSYSYAPKNIKNWLVGKDSLTITAPVTEEGSGADEITYTVTPAGGEPVVKTSPITDGAAQIAVSADFKGTVTIACTDKADNTSQSVTAGAGQNAEGFIIEGRAPQIDVQIDGGGKDEHGAASKITVSVADDADGAISSGLSSVTYKIGGGEETPVPEDFTESMKTGVTFAIPSEEIPVGETEITVTAIDHAGNQSVKTRTVTKEPGTVSKDVEKDEKAPDTDLSASAEELAEAILTEEERQKVENGTDIKFILDVKDAAETVSGGDREAVQAAVSEGGSASGFVVGQYLDISLLKVVGTERSLISQTEKALTIVIKVPESLKSADAANPRTFAVVRVYNGVAETLTDLDENADTITIATDRFASYAIVYKEAGAGTASDPAPNPASDPDLAPELVRKRNIDIHSSLKGSQTGKNLQISWGMVSGADGYDVYAQYCGKNFTAKSKNQVRSGKKTKIAIKKINGKKLDTAQCFKMYVVAWKWKDGEKMTLAKTLTIHVAGKDSAKYTNVKNIQVKKTSYTLKKGASVALKPKAVLYDSRKKQLPKSHTKEFRYMSSNEKVAAVTAGGKVKAKGTGSCTVYAIAKNGCVRKIKIKVKK